MKRVIIIDDEQDARDVLRFYISQHKDFVVIGEADNGIDAVQMVNTLQPDTIFLDIEMPGLSGFEVLTRLNEIPEVIFSSAHDKYAIKAFEVHAVDYLLKPYGKARFENALNRVLATNDNLTALTEELLKAESPFPRKILLNKGTRRLLISIDDIIYGKAIGDYTKIYTAKDELLSAKSIGYLMENWDGDVFIRLHRSFFVNKNFITEIQKKERYYNAILAGGQSVRIGDSFVPEIKKMMF
jgi:two-component system LytT family response regulator